MVVAGCMAFCWWQVDRALSGNELSWAYVFEWPIFAGYAAYMWWRLIHDQTPAATPREPLEPAHLDGEQGAEYSQPIQVGPIDDAAGRQCGSVPSGAAIDDYDDPEEQEREAYNRYLADLHTRGRRSRW